MLKKVLIVFFTLCITFLLFITPVAHAQAPGTWYNQNYKDWWLKVYDDTNPAEIFGERYTAAQVQWIIYSIIAAVNNQAMGPKMMSCVITLKIDDCAKYLISAAEEQTKLNASIAPTESPGIISQIFADRPLSAISYFKDFGRKFHIIPEANAQTTGFGFSALDPIREIWKGSRDISYAILVIITLVFAFMIMFRVKISPQVIITVQSALPKLALTIVLVTFSYAIAGLLVDLMYVVIAIFSILFASMLKSATPSTITGIFNFMVKGQPFNLPVQLGTLGLWILYLTLFAFAFAIVFVIVGGALVSALASIVLIALIGSGIGTIVVIIGILALLIVVIALMVILFKTWWMLIKAFANIILLTIFAPLQLTIGTLVPNLGFSAWVKSYVSNLAIFVTTGILYFLSFFFLIQAIVEALKSITGGDIVKVLLQLLFGSFASSGFFSGGVTTEWPPLLGTNLGGLAFLFLVVSFVIFTMIPKAAQLVESIFSGKPFAYGTAVGEAVGPVRDIARAGAVGYVHENPTTGLSSLLKTFGVVR
jgi:hypothetical protein